MRDGPRKPTCSGCPHDLHYSDPIPQRTMGVMMHLGERFCTGGKKARRFKRGDPKIYVPDWCPRRKYPCELRVYAFKSASSWWLHMSLEKCLGRSLLPEGYNYALPVSDRKYLNYYPIVQAKAWLSGHAAVESTDLLALKNYLWQKPGDRAVVEATLERMCVNPMQDKVNSIRAMSLEALDSFEDAMENATKPSGGAKALQKLRGELVRLYAVQQELANTAQSDSERALADSLLEDLEQTNRQASQAVNFTCMPLRELAAMQ